MSTRGSVASVIASVGVLAVGWQVGTHAGRVQSTVNTTTVPARQSTTRSAGASGTGASGVRAGSSGVQGGQPGGGVAGASGMTLSVPAGKSGTFTGQTVQHRWGSVGVTVTLASGRITGLSAQVDDGGDGHSARIDAFAAPALKQEILAAPTGGAVSTISGATYTSEAYLTSLQSALDQAR